MGFSLRMAPLRAMIDEGESAALKKLLDAHQIVFEDELSAEQFHDIDPFVVEDYEFDDEPDWIEIQHWEVGWSWWSCTQDVMVRALGEEQVPVAMHLHALHGVAVPGEIGSTMLGEPVSLEPRIARKPTFLSRLFRRQEDVERAEIDRLAAGMINSYGGPYSNLMVASATRLEQEISAAIDVLSLDRSTLKQRYEDAPEVPQLIGECYLLIASAFLNAAIKHRCLTWFIK